MIVYCDMDGVLSNFDDAFLNYLDGKAKTIELFREATEDNNLFSKLRPMDNAQAIVNKLNIMEKEGYTIEILSSLNTVNPNQKAIAIHDKHHWLLEHGINWPRNFVNRKEEKCQYATPNSVLIDDNMLNVGHFNYNHGYGIFHVDGCYHMTLGDLDQWIHWNPITAVRTT